MEKDIRVSCRSKDAKLVEKAVEEAASDFKSQAGFEAKLTVDKDLPEGR